MNRTAIKNFAIWARRSLREQVRARAIQFGISANEIQEAQEVSGGLVVAGQALNADEAEQYRLLRSHLQDLMRLHKQAQAIEMLIDEIAYTWFNRLAALRFMEANGYLTTRVLSSSDPKLVDPDMLRDAGYIAEAGEFPGLNLETLDEWRSLASRAPNPDEWLYRRLLVAQCEALADGLPFLFDRSKNYTALFVPANLLNQDSIVRRMVTEIPEEDWRDSSDSENGVEIIGWLYQFYISERKDEVIGAKSKVAAQDIPAATQLFTPHWIVRYMVENALGRLWLESHPESQLRSKMPYYLESPDSSTHSPTHPSTLQPQDLTVCDPACGSGHILVYAFDLLFEIYREQGYLERDIPGLILTHNLFGLDIDERAVQLASFAVLMKARAKNSRILRRPPALNIVTVRSTRHLAQELATIAPLMAQSAPIINHQLALDTGKSQQLPILQPSPSARLNELFDGLLSAFADADHLGSLITPPPVDAAKLFAELEVMEQAAPLFGQVFAALRHVVKQAELLRKQYWVVVANPPYMGSKRLNDTQKEFLTKNYDDVKSDLFSAFIKRNFSFANPQSYLGFVSPFVWMFLSSYEKLRNYLILEKAIYSLVKPSYTSFFESAIVPLVTFVVKNKFSATEGTYINLGYLGSAESQPIKLTEAIANPNCGYLYYAKASDFAKIPGSPIAFWISNKEFNSYENGDLLGKVSDPKKGMDTGENERFLRYWQEINFLSAQLSNFSSKDLKNESLKWFPYNKGGEYRKWYGNREYVINWQSNGIEIKQRLKNKKKKPTLRNQAYYFRDGYTWTTVSSSRFSARYTPEGALFDNGGCTLFSNKAIHYFGSLINSKVSERYLEFLSPTLNFQPGDISRILYKRITNEITLDLLDKIVTNLVTIAKSDWNAFEESWDFQMHPLLYDKTIYQLSHAFSAWKDHSEQAFQQLKQLEEENNHYWIETYGLQDELTPEVPDEQITIRRADLSRDIRSLISYAVGCMMGRYSLDQPGLIHAGQPFDPSQHTTFPADADAILPITDQAYFDDDIVSRFIEFIKTAYGETHLKENLDFIANALTLQSGESAQDRIRRYFLTEFISNHIQTYKKRPIYWLFTSGKNRAFGALVYLHRYTPNTVGQIRTDYVLELQRKLAGEITRTETQLATATASTAKKAIQRRLKTLRDQDAELAAYQAKLQTVADQRIELDLDDGVAYNYTRFKGLVYEGTDLKMADLEKKAQWKLDLLKQQSGQ